MGLVDLLEKDPKPRRTRRVKSKDVGTPSSDQGVPSSEPPSEPPAKLPSELSAQLPSELPAQLSSKLEDAEVEVPLIRKSSRPPAAKGVVFKVPPPPAPAKRPEPEGKGKGKVVEPASKKQKSTHTPSLPPGGPGVRFEVDVKRRLSLDSMSGPLGQGVAMASLDKVVQAMNSLGGDIWNRITDGSSERLYEFSMQAVLAVSLASSSILKHFLPPLFIRLTSLLTRVLCPKFVIVP